MTLIHALLVLAMLTVVPLGLSLLAADGVLPRRSSSVAAVLGVVASVGVVLPASPVSALMVTPWLCSALAMGRSPCQNSCTACA